MTNETMTETVRALSAAIRARRSELAATLDNAPHDASDGHAMATFASAEDRALGDVVAAIDAWHRAATDDGVVAWRFAGERMSDGGAGWRRLPGFVCGGCAAADALLEDTVTRVSRRTVCASCGDRIGESHPGKFEGCHDPSLAAFLSSAAECAEEDAGHVSDIGWWSALFIAYPDDRSHILTEDDRGFVSVETFDSEDAARIEWAEILRSESEAYDESEDDES